MQNEEYFNTLAISQSAIKDFKRLPPLEWKKIWVTKEAAQKRTRSLDKGNLVDSMLFNPEEVEDKYIVCNVKKPSDSISYIVTNVADKILAEGGEFKDLESYDKEIENYAKTVPMLDDKVGYGQKWDVKTLVSKVVKEGENYFHYLKSVGGKSSITSEDYMAGLGMAEAAKKSDLVKPYLDPENNIFQFEVVTDDDFPNRKKGCFDILHKNKKKKQIRIVDFKTADSAYAFEFNVRKFGYLDQVTFYDKLLSYWLSKEENEEYKDYAILPPINIVMDFRYNTPYIYEYSNNDMVASWYGYSRNGRWVKGMVDVIKDIEWHVFNDKWAYPKEHYDNGNIKLNLIYQDEMVKGKAKKL